MAFALEQAGDVGDVHRGGGPVAGRASQLAGFDERIGTDLDEQLLGLAGRAAFGDDVGGEKREEATGGRAVVEIAEMGGVGLGGGYGRV